MEALLQAKSLRRHSARASWRDLFRHGASAEAWLSDIGRAGVRRDEGYHSARVPSLRMALAKVRLELKKPSKSPQTYSNKTLMFGYVMVPKNIEWFKMLLAHTLPISEDDPDTRQFEAFHRKLQSIKPSQTIGTVLALNGWRYYFCMYHPMHAPSMVRLMWVCKVKTSSGSFGSSVGRAVDCRGFFVFVGIHRPMVQFRPEGEHSSFCFTIFKPFFNCRSATNRARRRTRQRTLSASRMRTRRAMTTSRTMSSGCVSHSLLIIKITFSCRFSASACSVKCLLRPRTCCMACLTGLTAFSKGKCVATICLNGLRSSDLMLV